MSIKPFTGAILLVVCVKTSSSIGVRGSSDGSEVGDELGSPVGSLVGSEDGCDGSPDGSVDGCTEGSEATKGWLPLR